MGRSGDLPAIQVGGRGQWQVERSKLEEYIKRMYELAANNLEKLPVEDMSRSAEGSDAGLQNPWPPDRPEDEWLLFYFRGLTFAQIARLPGQRRDCPVHHYAA